MRLGPASAAFRAQGLGVGAALGLCEMKFFNRHSTLSLQRAVLAYGGHKRRATAPSGDSSMRPP